MSDLNEPDASEVPDESAIPDESETHAEIEPDEESEDFEQDSFEEGSEVVFRPLVTALDNGKFKMGFPSHLCELLVSLANELDEVIDGDSPDLTRLFPTAYADDPDMDAGYQILARGQLVDHRRAAIDTVRESMSLEELDEEQISAWMLVINDLRLVIGTRLDVSEDDELMFENPDPEDPNGYLTEVYRVLGFMLGDIVDALTGTLPLILDEPLD